MIRLKNRKICEFSHDRGSMNMIFTKLQNDYMAGNFQSHWKNREILNFSRVTATRNNKIFLIDSVRAARSWIIAFIRSVKTISPFATYYFVYKVKIQIIVVRIVETATSSCDVLKMHNALIFEKLHTDISANINLFEDIQ